MASLTIDPYVRVYNKLADHGEICSGGFDPKNDPDDRRKLILSFVAGVLFILLFVLCSGCTRRVYIPVERTTTTIETLVDTVVEVRLKEIHDTISIETQGKDTLSYLDNEYAYSFASLKDGVFGHSLGILKNAKAKDSIKVVHVLRIDSIPYPVEVLVEKKLSFWQRIKIEYGGFAMGAAATLAFIMGLMAYSEKRKKD